jgi:elongation factor Ts
MHIAATNPKFVRREEVPVEELEKEKEILKAQALNEGKPAHIVEKMVEGRMSKYYEEYCLLEQSFIKDPDKTVATLVNEKISTIGENISIRRFARYELGYGSSKTLIRTQPNGAGLLPRLTCINIETLLNASL